MYFTEKYGFLATESLSAHIFSINKCHFQNLDAVDFSTASKWETQIIPDKYSQSPGFLFHNPHELEMLACKTNGLIFADWTNMNNKSKVVL